MNFRVYRSSAGSGKTFTLVLEYLKIALDNQPEAYRQILAITFTNKAAGEMKERVLQALKDFTGDAPVSGKNAPLFETLKTALGLNDEILRQRSRKVLTNILHNYADFSISTIDKFTHKIVRTFAHDLRLNVGFDVELDEKSLLKRAIDQLVARAGTDENLTKLLVDFTKSKMEEDRNWQIEQDLLDFSSILLEEEAPPYLRRLRDLDTADFFKVRKELKSRMIIFREKITGSGEKALKLMSEAGIEAASFAGGANGIAKYFSYLAAFRIDKLQPSATVSRNVSEDKWYASKVNEIQKQAIDSIAEQLKVLFLETTAFIEQQLPAFNLLSLIDRNIFSLALLNRVEEELENVKWEFNLLPISDFNKKISEVVIREPIPFIYERIGERYHHFLIDEFQDTSLLQWQNLLPLLENALGGGYFNMVVGDAKQAIYRWRGGEVEQFVRLPEIYKPMNEDFAVQKQMSLTHHFQEALLANNYRSKMEVVDFNNRFFESLHPLLSEYGSAIYRNVAQGYREDNRGGGVSIQLLEASGDKSYESLTCERVLEIVRGNLADGYEFVDMAVLCKKNREGAVIAQYLITHGIPVVSSESLLLISSPEVRTVIHLMTLLSDPSNHFLISKIIEYLHLQEKIEGALFEVTHRFFREGQSIFGWLKQYNIHLNDAELVLLPLYELAEAVMRAFGWMEKADPYLQALLDVIYKYSNKEGNERSSFLEWWKQKQTSFSVQVPEGTPAVHVMTVHKSKGLEFPVVIHPHATYDARIQRSQAWVDIAPEKLEPLSTALLPLVKQTEQTRFSEIYREEQEKSLLDMLNVLYVALTRPRERLYILTTPPSKGRGNRSVPDLLAHFYEQTEAFSRDPLYMQYGTFEKRNAEKKKENEELIMERFESADWKDRITVSYRSPLLWEEQSGKARDYGKLIHEILGGVRTINDLPGEIGKMQMNGMITAEETIGISNRLTALLNREELCTYYSQGQEVVNEVDILLPGGEGFRPDRVVLLPGETVVIDYKTGMEDSKHLAQLRTYQKLLHEMGYPRVAAYLVYIGGEEKIIKVA